MAHLISIGRPGFFWGPPGVGKSSIAKTVATTYGGFIDLRLSQLDIIDLRGTLYIEKGKSVWAAPALLPTKGKGVLFLDEFVQAMVLMQNTASQLVLDRRIGDYVLPDGWVVMAAGNRESDRAGTNKLPTHLANRFVHINVEVDYNDWLTWAVANDVHPMVYSFLGFRPTLLHSFDPNSKEKAFPSPRSWEIVSDQIKGDIDDEIFLETVSGTVGAVAGKEFVGFARVFRELPDYDEVIGQPDKALLPSNAASQYAVAGMIAARVEVADMQAVFKYLARMPKEYQITTVRAIERRGPELIQTRSYIKWATENKDLLMNRAPATAE